METTISPHSGVSRRRGSGQRGLAIVGVLASGVVAAAAAYALTHSAWSLLLIAGSLSIYAAWVLGAQATTGVFLLLIPTQWLVITLIQFNGIRQYQQISALKEVLLAAAFFWFAAHATRFRFTAPDILLMATLLIVLGEQIFYTDLRGLRDDWEWALAYMLGRVLTLSPSMQAMWAKAAVWMCAVLALAGAYEVLVLGSATRLLLVAGTTGETELTSTFYATGYSGIRAASAMVSPLSFSALCMVALILWWVYMRNPIPAILIAAGLALTLTRSAIIAVVLGMLVVALRRREINRILLLGIISAAALVAAFFALDLSHYVHDTFTAGGDTSTGAHVSSVAEGWNRALQNPAGLGAGTVGPHQLLKATNAISIESSYLTFAIEYGLVVGGLVVAFILALFAQLVKVKTSLGYAACSILLGFAILLGFGPIHLDIPLACWVWFPIGAGIAASTQMQTDR